MAESLPPLTALRAFEAAARHLSFSKAAAELHVTPAAISQQIRSLEEFLGVPLFHRLNRALTLTGEAQAGLVRLREGFGAIHEAVHQIRGYDRREVLTVWVAPSFASKWLVLRLHRFSARHPNINMRIEADRHLIDDHGEADTLDDYLLQRDVDVAVAFGRGEYPGCRVDRLLSVAVVPLCSPRLLRGEHPLREPADLRHHTLLHDDTEYDGRPEWRDWCRASGVEDLNTERGVRFNHVSLALEAAVDGQGVVLSLEPLAAADIAAGRLAVPFGPRLPLRNAYYVVSPEVSAGYPRVIAFRAWLLDEAAKVRPVSD